MICIKTWDDTVSEDLITDPRNWMQNRRRFTVVSDRRTFVTRIVDVPLRAIEIHPENSQKAIIEHDSRYSRLWKGTRMFEAEAGNPNGHVPVWRSIILSCYRSLGPSCILYDEMNANVGDIRRGFSADAILYVNLKSIPKYLNVKVSIIFLQKFVNKQY